MKIFRKINRFFTKKRRQRFAKRMFKERPDLKARTDRLLKALDRIAEREEKRMAEFKNNHKS